MTDYTTPIETTFELQRRTLTGSQQAIENGIDLQKQIAGATIDALDAHESTQRRAVELLQKSVHRTLDAAEALPGGEGTTDDVREVVDEQYEELFAAHEEAFEAITTELEAGVDAYDDLSAEYLETLDEQLALLAQAHEELESQSITATEQVDEQIGELQEQVEDVQEQIRDVSEQAADAIEA